MKRMLYCSVLAGSILCALNPTIATAAAIDEQGKPPRPAWVGSKAGASEGLLLGWEPVGVEDNIVRPWGRGYRFEGLPAPVEVTSAGASLLTGPIRFIAVIGGQEVSWTPRKTEIQKINDGVVRVITEADSDKVQLKGTVTVEFDGMVRSDWQVVPNAKVTLERLALEIPMKREHARYLYTFPGAWGKASNAGAAPTGPLDTLFRPFIWLGDESRGLGWFSESDRNFVGDASKITQIVPGDRETLLRINLVTQPMDALDKPLDYTFGFQATPVRDNPRDVWDFRMCHQGDYGIQDAPSAPAASTDGRPTTVLSRLAELGVRTICFHEHWTDIQNYTSTKRGTELHDLVRACHDKGIRLVLYFGYLMSDIAPEWAEYSDECLVYPRTGDYQRKPEQHAYSVCYRSVWQDFLADGIARIMDEYDIDGVYLDGTEYPWPCRNVKHGCGYTRPDGTVGETYTFFSTRDLMKRIWMIVKSRKPDGIVNVHSSTCMTTPTLAFATSYWDGEQLGGISRGPRALDVLPLETFRCEFMGHQWGIPAELLCYGQPYTYSEAMSFSLLHDVLVRGSLNGGLELESKLWKTMDEFGRHQARWLPYWNNRNAVTTDSDNTKVSLYSRGGKGVVAVMSNLAGEPRDVQVRLNLRNLQLSGELSAWDVISEHDVSLAAEGLIEQKLNPLDFRVIWVKPITPAGGQGKE